ncbi:MAG: hypothetical protein K8R25_00995, partial [Methanosarcinales archaeon]|nr:hypothetical protein [Methanosarcinales archaeon]
TRKTRLQVPDIIYYKPDTSVKFGHSITNVIEFESETSTATVADRVAQFNKSSRLMIADGAQNGFCNNSNQGGKQNSLKHI